MIKAEEVDEREVSWEIDPDAFRVFFTGPPPERHLRCYRVTECTYLDLRAWAVKNAEGREVSIAIELDDDDGVGLIKVEQFR